MSRIRQIMPKLRYDRAEWAMAVRQAAPYMRPRPSGCVEWTRRTAYTRFKCRPYPVARLVWEHDHGRLADDSVEQTCRTPFCVNADHLRLAQDVQSAVRP